MRVERRLAVYALVLVLIFMSMSGRLLYLQVVQGEHYSVLSEKNYIRIIPLPAPRGNYFDRYGQLVATNRPSFAVSLMELEDVDTGATVSELADILGVTTDEIQSKIDKHRHPFEPVRIATDVTPEVYTRVAEARDRLPGVVLEVLPVRDYVYGDLAAHLFGYVSEIGPEELNPESGIYRGPSYEPGDIVGKSGLEYRYDLELRGVDGGQQVEVDALGRLVDVLGETPPVNGQDLVLTIDAELQKIAEEFFDTWTARIRNGEGFAEKFPDADSGACVVMKVDTGEILAMFSRPAFDPNVFATGIDVATFNDLFRANPDRPMFNRVLQGQFPPGSTFKMVTAATALEELPAFNPDARVADPGYYGFGNVTFRDWKKGGHGSVDLVAALKYSCNTYFYGVGKQLGTGRILRPDRLITWSQGFGLGQPTGIDLYPKEATGYIAGSNLEAAWYPGMALQAAIGQGHDFTPLQMAVYTTALANGGIRYVPQVIKEIRSPDGRLLKAFEPEVAGQMDIAPETLELIRQGMVASATELSGAGGPGTSAWLFYNFPIKVAGKTGTATKPPGDDHAWYVAFAPAEDPEIAVVVLVERGGHGSTAAAPLAKAIFEQYFGLSQGGRPRPPSELPATSGGD